MYGSDIDLPGSPLRALSGSRATLQGGFTAPTGLTMFTTKGLGGWVRERCALALSPHSQQQRPLGAAAWNGQSGTYPSRL